MLHDGLRGDTQDRGLPGIHQRNHDALAGFEGACAFGNGYACARDLKDQPFTAGNHKPWAGLAPAEEMRDGIGRVRQR